MKGRTGRRSPLRKLSTLIILVFFVFIILLISIGFAALISHLMIWMGILPTLQANRFPVILLFILLVSLFIGTILAMVGGDYLVQPLFKMIEATNEIAAGNFDVRLDVNSSRELSRLAASFNAMAEELAGIETLRSDFVNNISHEFKTPVVSIRGFAKRLKKSNLSEEKRNEYLDIIIAETERLTNLSGNVLLLSKLESSDKIPEKSVYSLDEQIRNTILLLEPYFEHKKLDLDLDLETVPINANEEMLSHLWLNLLNNAIKFSPEETTITVSVKKGNGYAEVSIADMGMGMDEETKKRIFDKFYQSDKSRVTAGNGLGLSLVKRILQLGDGRIQVESVPGEGSCFTVRLPLD